MPKQARASFTPEERDLAVEACRVGLARLRPLLSADFQARADGLVEKLERLPIARPRGDGQAAPKPRKRQGAAAADPAGPASTEPAVAPPTDPFEIPDALRRPRASA